MSGCEFLRSRKWMEENHGKSVVACLYSAGHCKYWKKCAVEYSIDCFLGQHLNGLFQLSKDEILAERKRVRMRELAEVKKKLMRKQTRRYTYQRRNAKAK